MKTVLEVLKEARELLAIGWTQGEFLTLSSNGVACYCPSGAVRVCSGLFQGTLQWSCILELEKDIPSIDCLVGWNDEEDRTQAEVLDLFDKTIARLSDEM